MKTVIYDRYVIASGNVEVLDDKVLCGNSVIWKAAFPELKIIDAVPPSEGDWVWDGEQFQAYIPPEPEPDPEPALPAKVAPQKVSMRQARLALLQEGLLSRVQAAIDAIPDEAQRTAAQIEWEYATEVERFAQMTTLIGEQLGLTGDQLDDLFILAATL